MRRSADTKNKYQIMIRTYVERREEIRKRLPPGSPGYRQATARIREKLSSWRKAIRRIERREAFMNHVAEVLLEFIGQDVRFSGSGKQNKDMVLARLIFYKYCIEHSMPGREIARITGMRDSGTPTNARLRFNKRIQSNSKDMEMWRRFKVYITEFNND